MIRINRLPSRAFALFSHFRGISILLWSLSEVQSRLFRLAHPPRGAGRRKGVVPEARRRLGQATAHATKTTPNPETDMSRKFLTYPLHGHARRFTHCARAAVTAKPSRCNHAGATTREQRLRRSGRRSARPLRDLRRGRADRRDGGRVRGRQLDDAGDRPAVARAAGHRHRPRRPRPHRAARDADEPRTQWRRRRRGAAPL